MKRLLLACAALLALGHAVPAAENFPGVIGTDDRQSLSAPAAPWNALGKVQAAGYSRIESCTGTLIGPKLVVTAAHCLFDQFNGKQVPVARLNFLAGVFKDKNAGVAKVECIKTLDYVPARKPTIDNFRLDVALLVLDHPLQVAPIALADDATLTAGTQVSHAGYGRDRKFILSVHKSCKVTGLDKTLAITDCDTNFGQSGGPLLVDDKGEKKIAAIVSGFSEHKASIAVTAATWRDLAKNASCSRDLALKHAN